MVAAEAFPLTIALCELANLVRQGHRWLCTGIALHPELNSGHLSIYQSEMSEPGERNGTTALVKSKMINQLGHWKWLH